MGVFEMIVAIVGISVIGNIIIQKNKIKAESSKAGSTASDNDITRKRLADMEKRLIVLEQIVTSEDYQLKQQFKNIEND